MIVYKDLSLTVLENQFYTPLFPINQPVIQYTKKLESDFFKKRSFLSHITFYIEDDDHKPVGLNGETISFICQLIKV